MIVMEVMSHLMARRVGGSAEMLSKLQAQRLGIIKTDLEEFGESWSPRKYGTNMWFESGSPDMFWIHVDTKVLPQLILFIKVLSDTLSCPMTRILFLMLFSCRVDKI